MLGIERQRLANAGHRSVAVCEWRVTAPCRLTDVKAGGRGVARLPEPVLMSNPSASPIQGSQLPLGAVLGRLSQADLALVLANARLLESTTSPLQRQGLLRGKNVALLCASPDDLDALLFQRAASELGAHVSHIRPDLPEPSSSPVFRHTAQMLGRLYQAVECEGIGPGVVADLGRVAGIPVYDALASRGHPLAALAELLDGGADEERNRRLIVQAVLVSTIG